MDFWGEVLDDPRGGWRPLPWQYRFLASEATRRLLRAGNQLGKTEAGCEDIVCHATGVNPWGPAPTKHAIEAWIICASWTQSVAVQGKLWRKLPKDRLHPSVSFDEVNGFSPTKSPAVRILHADGNYSLIRIKTLGQGGLNLSSATIQYAWFDEPPSPNIYTEVLKRVQRAGKNGKVIVTITPINAEVGWLQELTEAGALEDHHQRLEPEAMIPLWWDDDAGEWVKGHTPITLDDGEYCDSEWVNRTIKETPSYVREIRCHGEWMGTPDGAVFDCFRVSGPRCHATNADPSELPFLALGIDHGVRTYTQVAVLVGIDHEGCVWVIDEYVGETETTDDDDADGILSMLERNGLVWAQLDEVHGDRAHYGNARGPSVAAKSNGKLARAILRQPLERRRRHRIGAELAPQIRRAKSGLSARPGSVEYGCEWLHKKMVADKFRINRRCKRGIPSIVGYTMKQNTDESHFLDGLRYGLRTPIWKSDAGNANRARLRIRR